MGRGSRLPGHGVSRCRASVRRAAARRRADHRDHLLAEHSVWQLAALGGDGRRQGGSGGTGALLRCGARATSPGFVLGRAGTLDETVINTLPAETQQAIRDWHEGGWTPMRRLATPAEIGGGVGLLCARLHVDGGASLMDAFSRLGCGMRT